MRSRCPQRFNRKRDIAHSRKQPLKFQTECITTLAPNHKGALNYSGIAYVKIGRLPEAQAQLARLKAVCADCEETAELSRSIADAQTAAK